MAFEIRVITSDAVVVPASDSSYRSRSTSIPALLSLSMRSSVLLSESMLVLYPSIRNYSLIILFLQAL